MFGKVKIRKYLQKLTRFKYRQVNTDERRLCVLTGDKGAQIIEKHG